MTEPNRPPARPPNDDDHRPPDDTSGRRAGSGDRVPDPYRQVRRRLRDRAQRGDEPFANWLPANEDPDDSAWWERTEESAMLPHAPNWRAATVVGHLVPTPLRQTPGMPSWGMDTNAAWPPIGRGNDPFALTNLRGHTEPRSFDDAELEAEVNRLFDDWGDDPPKRGKGKKRPKRRE